jgi:hypothetical protein
MLHQKATTTLYCYIVSLLPLSHFTDISGWLPTTLQTHSQNTTTNTSYLSLLNAHLATVCGIGLGHHSLRD